LFAASVAGLALAACALAVGDPAPAPEWTTYRSRTDGLTVRFPSAWQAASSRLVPELVNPKEILSLGTFTLPVGGGGNCDRYPAAALVRMAPADRMISIQRAGVGPHASWIRGLDGWREDFQLEKPVRFRIRHRGSTGVVWTNVLNLRHDGHAYGVFVAYGSLPSEAEAHEVEGILGTLRFRA
jgi:hypothetical protein